MKGLLIITQKVDKNDQLLGFFIDWLNRLAEKFDLVTVLCLERGDFDLPANVKVISLGKERGSSKLKQLSNFYFLIYTFRNDYDTVFVHMNPIWIVAGGLVWWFMNKKIIFWYTHKAVTWKLRIAAEFADVILTASKESFRLQSDKVIVTGHGINTELFRPKSDYGPGIMDDSQLKILSVGRIAPVKNYECLINAAEILTDRKINFKINMIGETALSQDKSYQQKLETKIKELHLENKFNFLGKITYGKLPNYYQNNDIFVHLSKTGSLDKVILEAMASGMKVLSSNDASKAFLPPEMIFDDNNPRELADKIVELAKKNDFGFLRDYVVKNHNLDNLIGKIYSFA